MDDVASSLESLIHKATCTRSSFPNESVVAEVVNLLEREPYYAHVATKIMAVKIQSSDELEALQTLAMLDLCMKQCGMSFHAEVGKFRFLNEMIKLVSPKYLGSQTPPAVRQKVLELMHSWTQEYARELKIKEAYDMLKKQGVIKDNAIYINPQLNPPPPRPKNSIFEDEERSRLLQKLLQSKNPDDLQAANRLIKTMVKEDERRVELNTRRITELESVHNNVRLLSEMLDSYQPGQSSEEEFELIKELHQSCERLRPNVFRLASETQDNEQMLNEVLSASDELGQVFDKYTAVIIRGELTERNRNASLLDLTTPSEETLPPIPDALIGFKKEKKEDQDSALCGVKTSDIEELGDIFGALPVLETSVSASGILKPVAVQKLPSKLHPNVEFRENKATHTDVTENVSSIPEKPSKGSALEDLDALSESLLKQNLPTACKLGSNFTKSSPKVPMNLLSKSQGNGSSLLPGSNIESQNMPQMEAEHENNKLKVNFDLDFLIGGAMKSPGKSPRLSSNSELLNGDDSMVDISEDNEIATAGALGTVSQSCETAGPVHEKTEETKEGETKTFNQGTDADGNQQRKIEVKSLMDIFVSVDSIKPGPVPPLPVLEEKNGVSVILHFAKDTPRPDVSVIVVTTISKNQFPLKEYIFQAVVPKSCKCRLLPPSGSELPAHNPFLPPSAITQVMLIANPNKDVVSLKFMVSYTMEDETCTEMGEVEKLPITA